jgi:hypothetical protein
LGEIPLMVFSAHVGGVGETICVSLSGLESDGDGVTIGGPRSFKVHRPLTRDP